MYRYPVYTYRCMYICIDKRKLHILLPPLTVSSSPKMGILMKVADAMTVLFLTIVTVVGLLTNGHVFLPSHYYLKHMIDSFIRDKKHYLLLEKPDFYRALLYYHLVVNWPLAVISLYGFLFRKSWIRTTSLILAVSFASFTVSLLFFFIAVVLHILPVFIICSIF